MDKTSSNIHLYESVFILNIIYLVDGMALAWSSPVLIKLQLPATQGSTVASMLCLGSVLGPLISGALLNFLGRKGTVGLNMGLMLCSCIMLTFATNVTELAIGRLVAGLAFGITFSSVPLYIAEISTDSVRGLLNTVSQISIACGSLVIYAIGPFVSYAIIQYMMIGICTAFFVFFPLLPKSPHSLVMKNNVSGAREALTWLRGAKAVSLVEKELQAIQKAIHQKQTEKGSIKDLFSSVGNRHALLFCCGLLILQQLSGTVVVLFYAQEIFNMTGTAISSSMCSLVMGIIATVSSFNCPLAVKYFGYKKPLLASISGMTLGMGTLSMFFYWKSKNNDIQHIQLLPLLSVVLYVFSYKLGWVTIPWALSGELFPNNVKPLATTIITSVCGSFAFIATKLYPELMNLIGVSYLFMICTFFSSVAIVFVLLLMKETSGLSLAEIQEMLNGKGKMNVELQKSIPSETEDCIL